MSDDSSGWLLGLGGLALGFIVAKAAEPAPATCPPPRTSSSGTPQVTPPATTPGSAAESIGDWYFISWFGPDGEIGNFGPAFAPQAGMVDFALNSAPPIAICVRLFKWNGTTWIVVPEGTTC